jgi:hypothetical protein
LLEGEMTATQSLHHHLADEVEMSTRRERFIALSLTLVGVVIIGLWVAFFRASPPTATTVFLVGGVALVALGGRQLYWSLIRQYGQMQVPTWVVLVSLIGVVAFYALIYLFSGR